MKRHILLLALMCSCFISCEIENADTPTRERYPLERYASETTDSRVIFPLAMMETAFNIETYENATDAEKVNMTYIFQNILKQNNSYKMKNFYAFYLLPDGNSIHTAGSTWHFSALNYGTDPFRFTLNCSEDGKWEMSASYHDGGLKFNISQLPQDESIFNWEISVTGSLTSREGRTVTVSSAGPITRKVCSNEWKCTTVMTGTLQFDIYDSKDSSTKLDSFTYMFSGKEETNTYYQL